ncbi:hypothetical protein GCM10023107_42600 [Actinoplanes octamycinicus]|nr:hypothetical protein Aoc01nite_55730 [Actinoplanes octamycinicus]
MSAKRKVTRRRDNDPVRVYADGRVSYWTGGKPGDGDRKQERCGTRENAEERAEELRARLREGLKGVAPRTEVTLDELAQAALDTLRKERAPEGTIRQYKSDWNVHVPAEVGAVRCRDTEMYHFTSIFSGLVAAKASEQVVKNVARTVGHFIQFGVNNSYFKGNPFGTYEQRRGVVKMYRSRAAVEGHADKITVDLCPEVTDVDEYAASLELQYPHYGDRLAWLTFGSGLRICEALALRDDSIDLKTLDVQVDWQLDRYGSWPDLALPKGGKTRTTRLWSCYTEIAESLIEDARSRKGPERGWLFPRHRSRTKWADQAGKLAGAARKECDWIWTFHWLRHGYASWSLAPVAEGGYEIAPARVQKWLGHGQLSTTLDTYVHKSSDDDEHLRATMRRLPGRRTGK